MTPVRILIYGGLLACVLMYFLFLSGKWMPNAPSWDQYPIRGVDVSHHNGEVDWAEFSKRGNDHRSFVIMKATEGSDWTDPAFAKNWKEARKANLIVGAYHFFSTQSSGAAQAAHFIRTVPKTSNCLPPVIDVEVSGRRSHMSDRELLSNLRVLSNELKRHYGQEPIIYTTAECQVEYLKERQTDRLWIRAVIGWPNPLAEDWLFWQFSSRGSAPGIEGRVDLNVFRHSTPEFEALLSP